jgi:hypothetical protein
MPHGVAGAKLGNPPTKAASPAALAAAPVNLAAIGPRGFRIGGATTKMGGIGIPGSMGAWRMVVTSDAIPWAACQAVCSAYDLADSDSFRVETYLGAAAAAGE